MSYNNFLDANAALELAKEYEETAVAIIKHNNLAASRSARHR